MIRLDIRATCGYYSSNHIKCLLRLEPELRNLGIEFVTHNGDIQLIQCVSDVAHLVDRNIPTILQDIYLGPEIYWHGLREFMLRDNVKAVLKTSKFVDPAMYDMRFQDDMKHVAVLARNEQVRAYGTNISHVYHKVHVFANLIAWDHFQHSWQPPDLDARRDIDVNIMLGNIDEHAYPVEETRSHRWAALYEVKKLFLKYPHLKVYLRTPQDKYLNGGEYHQVMQNSKVCLSPWGYDITCWRDYECALCGVLVIRPHMPWATTWPELPIITCEPDLSNFEDVVMAVLSNFSGYRTQRLTAYNTASLGMDNKVLAKRLADIIKLSLDS